MTRRARCIVLIAGLLIGGATIATGMAAEGPAAAHADLSCGIGFDQATRSLQGVGKEFAADCGIVYCLARVVDAPVPTTVTFVWYRDGRTMARVELPVRSRDYRTWTSKNIMPAWTGAWEVKVLDPQGLVLGTSSFTITAESPDDHAD